MGFEFATAGRIVFGHGAVREVPVASRLFGRRALLVTGGSMQAAAALADSLKEAGLDCRLFSVAEEPTIDLVRRAVGYARAGQCDHVIGCGGGSAIDAAKAVAALMANPGDPLDYIEVIGQGKPLVSPSAPCIAIPTTAGTGAEVTRNAVLASPEQKVKASLRSPHMLPRLAVVDPDLTSNLPPALTASTGLDALTQLIEPYVSVRANPMTDMFCLEGIRHVARSLRSAYGNGLDAEARCGMALASLLGGLALANAGLGAVHGFAAPIGGMFPAPHGAVCAALLPAAIEVNIHALRSRAAQSDRLQRYETVARILTGEAAAGAEAAASWVRGLCDELNIQPLRAYGITEHDTPDLVEKASQASSMKGNPIPLTPAEMREILLRSL